MKREKKNEKNGEKRRTEQMKRGKRNRKEINEREEVNKGRTPKEAVDTAANAHLWPRGSSSPAHPRWLLAKPPGRPPLQQAVPVPSPRPWAPRGTSRYCCLVLSELPLLLRPQGRISMKAAVSGA